jgi:hypothetical protein
VLQWCCRGVTLGGRAQGDGEIYVIPFKGYACGDQMSMNQRKEGARSIREKAQMIIACDAVL